MIPLPSRLIIAAASWIVPSTKRAEWRREWEAELWHRAERGAAREELLHRALGAFRDAAFLLHQHRMKYGFDLFRRPLRTETMFLGLALLCCLIFGAFRTPHLPYRDADRVVIFERNLSFAGNLLVHITPRLTDVWHQGKSFSDLAPYRTLMEPEFGIHVAPNFFDLLGVKARLGRTFGPNDGPDAMVIPDETWRTVMHADPTPIGKTIHIGSCDCKVVGVMGPDFFFRTRRIRFFALFSGRLYAAGMVARMKPGVTVAAAQVEVRSRAKKVETRWIADAFGLLPVLVDMRLRNLLLALQISGIAAILAMAFLIVKHVGKWRYWSVLGARVFLAVFGLSLLRLCIPGSSQTFIGQLSTSIFGFWIFLLVCCAATCLLVIDHRRRCPVCLRVLRKPVAIGSWASQILDQPATEYLCPAGHGTMYISETGNAPDAWTKLDESWQEFFVHSE